MDSCDGTNHYWSDDSYAYGNYSCPGYPRCKSEAVMRERETKSKLADEAKAVKKAKKSKAQRAEELKAQAAQLEREAAEDAIRERCSYQGVEWDRKGQAKAHYTEFVPCTGTPNNPHHDTYTDEYGSWVSCSHCNGNGSIFTSYYIRVPQYDAPPVPKEPV